MSHGLRHLLHSELTSLRAYSPYPSTATIRLDANESPLSLPERTKSALLSELGSLALNRYPDPNAHKLKTALAGSLNVDAKSIVVGSGSDELIALLITALSKPQRSHSKATVVFPDPTFVMYDITSRAHGLKPVGVELDQNWNLDVQAMVTAINHETPNLIFIASPNNPTGNTYPDDTLRDIVNAAPNSLVVIDEAYAAFTSRSLTQWSRTYPNVAVMGTLSKVGFAALRVGWVCLPSTLSEEIEKVRQPYNLNSLSQLMATRLITDHASWIQENARLIATERDWLRAQLAAISSLIVYPSDANFLLVKVDDAQQLSEKLEQQDILVRCFPDSHPRLRDHIRITVGTHAENTRLLETLNAIQDA